MTRSTAKKKTTPKKPAAQKKPTEAPAPEPMDPSAPEVPQGAQQAPAGTNHRTCYALAGLVGEFRALFPETPSVYSEYNGRNVALSVAFDLSVLGADVDRATTLLGLVRSDERVAEVLSEEDATLVRFHNNPRFYDSRETFALAEAWSVLTEAEEQVAEAEQAGQAEAGDES